ncbi:cytochrome o ubiquinol oxidase subunit II [Candidatus Profftella armatura (Diaphorina cf. continua)]|uniref:Ubiquinol oxidase subunit 2 n=1 Tax=Candidatus Profftella armatura (Diaphorina cf. continua) TaxID=2661583 RepID=A0A7R6VYQ4_9PROT|nr:ubiquinol oxidase subunit II [Candidatus Profftella armatura (Diaphorina cf. continua)]BCG49597.1 cytochrome o ubiquinol oxidase subunit II [Candidatus Profftella armatura (Diaphorina cf. continua)]
MLINIIRKYKIFLFLIFPLFFEGCKAVLLSPSGDIALQQRNIIIISMILVLIIIVPVMLLTIFFSWYYRSSNINATYSPEWGDSNKLEYLIWSIPVLIILILGTITWISTHKLDPYQPLSRISSKYKNISPNIKPLIVEVVSLDWKWLFFYPQQGIATINELAAPINYPIEFKITSSNMMNSFFIPALAGQIYTMPGMETKLHAVINKIGKYEGFSSNYSGLGFSGMRFKFYGMNKKNFNLWIKNIKNNTPKIILNKEIYTKLLKPSQYDPVYYYANVLPNLYEYILNKKE